MPAVHAPTVSYHRVLKRARYVSCSFPLIFSLLSLQSIVTALVTIGNLKPSSNLQPACRRATSQFHTPTRTNGEYINVRGFKIIDRCNHDCCSEVFKYGNREFRLAIKCSINDNVNSDADEVWKVGNVENDFQNLERAIMYSNAAQNLFHEERLEALDYFAEQRIPVASALRTRLVIPLAAIFVVSHLLRRMIFHRHISTTMRALARLCQQTIHFVSLAQFLSLVIVAPIVILCLQIRRESKAKKAGSLSQVDPASGCFDSLHYLVARSNSMDETGTVSSSSTRDDVKCLLEQWVSCIFGMILSGTIWIVAALLMPGTIKIPSGCFLSLQLLTRLGVMTSLQQYQSLWFALFRKRQPRPLNWPIWATQKTAASASNIWFVSLDVISLCLSSPVLMMFLSTMTVSSLFLWLSVVLSERALKRQSASHHDQTQHFSRIKKMSLQVQELSRFSTRVFLVWLVWSCRQLIKKAFATRTTLLAQTSLSNLVSISTVIVAAFGPVCHIVAMVRLIDVIYRHNASLAMNSEDFEEATDLRRGASSWKWRYRLRWREPQRVKETLRNWWNDFWYTFFFGGSVDEKLRQEQKRKFRESGAKARGLSVLQRVAAENPSAYFSNNDRTQWKTQAMKRIAQKHQEDYSRGSYDDPLGVAVYRTLGIGLGFDFDHMSSMNNTQQPSIRKLQSRAAKSAIRRVNDIYNTEGAFGELNQVADHMERQKRASTLRQEAEEEVKKLADRLTDLVPSDLLWDESESEMKVEQYHTSNYLGSSKHRYIIPSIESESPAIKNLLYNYTSHPKMADESFEIDYLNPMGVHDSPSDDEFIRDLPSDDEFIREFIREWSRNNKGSNVGNTKYSDDGENLIETILA